MLPNSLVVFLESRKVPSSLLCVHLASALQCYYAIEQWSFYFWLTVDDLALNPWPEYCLNVKWANLNKLAGSTAHHSPALSHNCYKQPRLWWKTGALTSCSVAPSGARGPRRVFANSIATCSWATWGWAGWTSKLLWGEEQLREASPNALLRFVFFRSICSGIVSLNMVGKNLCVLHSQLHLPASRDAAWAKLLIGFYFQMQFIMDCITSPWMCWS